MQKTKFLLTLGSFLILLFTGCKKTDLDTSVIPEEEIEIVDFPHINGEGQAIKFSVPSLPGCKVVLDDWMYILNGLTDGGKQKIHIWATRNLSGRARRGKINFKFENGQEKAYIIEQDAIPNFGSDMAASPAESKARFGIGYGIDLSMEYSTKAIRGEVFQVENLYNQGHIRKITASQETELSEYTGETKREIGSKLTIKAEGSGEYAGFSAEAKAAFNMENTQSSNNQYAIMSFSSNKGIYEIDPSITDYTPHLSKNAINNINNINYSPIELFKHYGTHVVIAAYEGARFNYSMTLDREKIKSSVDISGFAKAGFKNKFVDVSVEVSAEEKKSFEENKSHCRTKSLTVGGPENSSDIINNGDFKTWMSLIKEENWAMIGFVNKNSLIPIWELATDQNRRKEIQAAAISYINSKWDPDNKKTIKIEVPSFDPKGTLVKSISLDGVTYAEICNEYIPEISRENRQTVIYPVNPINGKVIYDRGFFIGNQNNKPAWIVWDDEKIVSVKHLSEFPLGALKTVYACGNNFTERGYGDVFEGKITDQYSHCDFADNSNIGLVKLGTNIFARENTCFNRTRHQYNFDIDKPITNSYNSKIGIADKSFSFFWNKDAGNERYYGYKFAHPSPVYNDNLTLWRPIGFKEINLAQDFILNDKSKWLLNAVSGLDFRFEGYLWNESDTRHAYDEQERFWFGTDMSISIIYKAASKSAEIIRPDYNEYKNYAASIRFIRSKTFHY